MSKYIVKMPFQGFLQDIVDDSESTKHWEGLGYKVLNETEIDALFIEYEQSQVTAPKSITAEYYNGMLEVLPPCRWSTYGIFSAFHVSERISGNLVDWYGKCGDKHFTFVDMANLASEQVATKFKTALEAE